MLSNRYGLLKVKSMLSGQQAVCATSRWPPQSVRPYTSSIWGEDAGSAGGKTAVPRAPLLIDLDTASEWDFAGRATSGPFAGKTLARVPHLLEYWFDWQTYWPKSDVYKPWRPTPKAVDRLEVPKPAS